MTPQTRHINDKSWKEFMGLTFLNASILIERQTKLIRKLSACTGGYFREYNVAES